MKTDSALLPLVDLVFLALGGILACMTQMEVIHALPIEVTQVGTRASVVRQGSFSILALDSQTMTLDGKDIALEEVPANVMNKKIILRADKELPTQRTVEMLALLAQSGADVSIEVKETKSNYQERG